MSVGPRHGMRHTAGGRHVSLRHFLQSIGLNEGFGNALGGRPDGAEVTRCRPANRTTLFRRIRGDGGPGRGSRDRGHGAGHSGPLQIGTRVGARRIKHGRASWWKLGPSASGRSGRRPGGVLGRVRQVRGRGDECRRGARRNDSSGRGRPRPLCRGPAVRQSRRGGAVGERTRWPSELMSVAPDGGRAAVMTKVADLIAPSAASGTAGG